MKNMYIMHSNVLGCPDHRIFGFRRGFFCYIEDAEENSSIDIRIIKVVLIGTGIITKIFLARF